MEIKEVPIEEIKPAPYNPRVDLQPGDVEYENLKRSIMEFGVVQLLVWNQRSGNLVGGHQTFKVLLELGRKKVPCAVVDLDEKKEKLLNVALNKIGGDWDERKLSVLLQDLSFMELEMTGFEPYELKELEEIIEEVSEEVHEEEVEGMPLKSFEHYDYLFFVFRDIRDWMRAMQEFDVRRVNASYVKGKRRMGLGRVFDGKKLLGAIAAKNHNNEPGEG